jgi:hypothetical protein
MRRTNARAIKVASIAMALCGMLCAASGCRVTTPAGGIFKLRAPDVQPPSGDISTSASVGIGLPTDWGTMDVLKVCFTTDGRDPTDSDPELQAGYSSANSMLIPSGSVLTVKARCFMEGYEPSDVTIREYTTSYVGP